MKNIILILITFCSACCQNNKVISSPNIKDECKIAGENSRQCHIYNLKDYTEDEKEATMGALYLFGADDVSINYDRAYYWLKRAEQNGNGGAENALGIIYWLGLGKEKNAELAEKYFLLSIKHGGDNEAIINLADYYRTGINDNVVDFEKAKKMYLEGAKYNPSRAYNGLSILYNSRRDYKNIYKYALKGAEYNNPESQYNLGVLYDRGYYVEQDKQKARFWYEKSALQGNRNAQNKLLKFLNDK